MLAHERGHTYVIVAVNADDARRGALNNAKDAGYREQGEGAFATSEGGPEHSRDARDAGWSKGWSNHDPGRVGSVPTAAWVGLVFALALAVRLWGINWQLPSALYYDEMYYLRWASAVAEGRRPPPTDYRNPLLSRHIHILEMRLAQRLFPIRDDRQRAEFQMLMARVSTAVLGAGAAVLTALAAQALFGGVAGLITGLLMTLSPLHVHMSHIAVNDIPGSFFMAASLLAGVLSLRKPSVLLPLLAALLAGLAFAAKFNFGVVVALPLMGLMVHAANGRYPIPRVFIDTFGATVLAFGVGCCIGMPEIITDFAGVSEGFAEQLRTARVASDDQSLTPVPLLYAESTLRGLGPLGLLAAVAGAVVLARARPGPAIAVLSCLAVYLVIMLRNELFAARYALPLVIVAAVLAGGIGRFIPRVGHLAAGLCGLLLLAPLARDVVQHNRLAVTSDTRVLAEQWIRQGARGNRVAAQAYSLPPEWDGRPTIQNVRISRFQSLISVDAERRLQCDDTRFVLLASFNYEPQLRAARDPSAETGYSRLVSRAEHVQRFSPFPDGVSAPVHPDDKAIPFWYMHSYERPGPTIDIYRISDAMRAECR
jgi:hypothetical protein